MSGKRKPRVLPAATRTPATPVSPAAGPVIAASSPAPTAPTAERASPSPTATSASVAQPLPHGGTLLAEPAAPEVPPAGAHTPSTVDLALAEQARSAAAHAPSREGAAVRDEQGRISTGIEVSVASLRLSPLRTAVVAALIGGARRLVSAAVVTDSAVIADVDATILQELGGPAVPVQILPASAR